LRIKTRKCKYCLKIFEYTPPKNGKDTRQFCNPQCSNGYRKGKTLYELFGIESKKSTGRCKECHNEFGYYRNTVYGKFCSNECYIKYHKRNGLSEETRKKLSIVKTGRKTKPASKHWKEIEYYAELLQDEDTRVVPITNAIPDILLIKGKDIRVYGIEVQNLDSQGPEYKKYRKSSIKKYLDNIIWVLLRKKKFIRCIKQETLEKND